MTLLGPIRFLAVSPLRHSLLLLALLVALPAAAAYPNQPLSTDHDGKISARHLAYWIGDEAISSAKPLKPELDAQQWQRVARTPVNMGFVDQPVWFRLKIYNPSSQLQQRYLEIAYPLLDDVRIYVYSGDTLIDSSAFGDEFPFDNRPIQYPSFVKQLSVPSGATIDLLVRVESISSLQFPVSLWQGDSLLHTTSIDTLLNGIYYGTLLVMLIYNLFAYINARESKYLYYAFYITSIGTFFACMSGIGSQYLWPESAGISKRIIVLSLASTIFFAGLFTRSFLALPDNRPLLDKLLRGISGIGAAIAVSSLFLPYSLVIQPMILMIVCAASIALLSGFVRWRDGHPAAMLFCLAWLILGFGGTAMAANKLGWVPRTPITEYTAQLGSMLEFILLSLALIQQLNIERQAKSEAQWSALNFERQANLSRQQSLMVQQQAAQELEERVEQRTMELQIANEKLSALSTTDALTGLKNRRFFNERYLAEFVRSKRDGTPISVIIIDVDHFKRVNDNHGHLQGDEVLKLVAKHIEAEARRESDIVTRHGGEEFSAVLIHCSPLQALDMAEKIRERVAGARYQTAELALSCTVSVGVATMTPHKHSSPEELINQADAALYQSKASGRNRVSVHSERAA